MTWHRRIFIGSGVLVVVVFGYLYYGSLANEHVIRTYTLAAEFTSMPDNDGKLEEWLKVQEGLLPRPITVVRSGKRLKIIVDIHRGPGVLTHFLPNLQRECEQLGYTGRSSPFSVHLE